MHMSSFRTNGDCLSFQFHFVFGQTMQAESPLIHLVVCSHRCPSVAERTWTSFSPWSDQVTLTLFGYKLVLYPQRAFGNQEAVCPQCRNCRACLVSFSDVPVHWLLSQGQSTLLDPLTLYPGISNKAVTTLRPRLEASLYGGPWVTSHSDVFSLKENLVLPTQTLLTPDGKSMSFTICPRGTGDFWVQTSLSASTGE